MSKLLLQANIKWAIIHTEIDNKNPFDINYENFSHLVPNTWVKLS